jgi:hypothetical protein
MKIKAFRNRSEASYLIIVVLVQALHPDGAKNTEGVCQNQPNLGLN